MSIDLWKPFAGLMLFLLAMSLVEEAIGALAGSRVKQFIQHNTESRLRGILSGTLATAILQSSSLVGLLVLALVGAKVMKLKDALLIIFGANLGTTATGWIVATIGFKLNFEAASLPLIALGGLWWIVSGSKPSRYYGRLALGIGLLLLALQFMKSTIGDVESIIEPEVFAQFETWQFVLFGVVFSAVVQSSSAAMVITLSALDSGLIDLTSAAATMIGADLGTTTTIVFGAIGSSAVKKRVALGHVLFNIVTDAIAYILLIPLVGLVARLNDPLLSLVAFHSVFNVLGVFLWTPLTARFASFLETLFAADVEKVGDHLDQSTQAIPETAVIALINELGALAKRIVTLNTKLFWVAESQNVVPTKLEFEEQYQVAKTLEGEILEYSLDLDLPNYPPETRASIENILQAGRSLLLSAKLCKECLNDMRELAECHAPLLRDVLSVQNNFYQQFGEVADDYRDIGFDQLEDFAQFIHERHDWLHARIYAEIRADNLPLELASSTLNLNRGLYNSNNALVSGVATFVNVNTPLIENIKT